MKPITNDITGIIRISIIRRIIREHGGDIKISSEEGFGTSVCISLPRQQRNVRLLPLEQKK